jgi:glycosyltransferase involved in cell wall biosynthesis
MTLVPGTPSRRTLVIVPAWNEAAVIERTIAEIAAAEHDADVVVVDDGSGDGTADLAARAGAKVLRLPFNMGVGAAMRTGFLYAWREGYDDVVQVDADGQHNPANIPLLIERLRAGDADIVIGSRFAEDRGYPISGPRKWAISMLSFVLTRLSGERLTDITSGFRAANRQALGQYLRHYPNEYLGDTVDSLVIAVKSGYRVAEVPVTMRTRQGGAPSHSPLRSGLFLIRSALVVLLALTTRTRPRSDSEVAHGHR